jgi:cathepsin H
MLARCSLLALAAAQLALEQHCATQDDSELFACWQRVHGVVAPERTSVFLANLARARAHNADPTRSWDMNVNEFAAMTWEEFRSTRLGAPQQCSATGRTPVAAPAGGVPAEMDWRTKGVITPVKNQGQCGSCWTFSTTGVVEAHHAIATQQLVTLSEQQLVDCAQAFDNHGCNGGLPSQAMEYIHFSGGLATEAAYPYHGKDGKCTFTPQEGAVHVADVVNVTAGDEDSILAAIGSTGPVSIAYDCTDGFQLYHSGVYDGWHCPTSPDKVNHAVLAVGYGHDTASKKDYWLVKNSWGAHWGIDGYFKIRRGVNKCGLSDCASYPIMATQELFA